MHIIQNVKTFNYCSKFQNVFKIYSLKIELQILNQVTEKEECHLQM